MNFDPLRQYMASLIERGVPGLELAVCRDHEIIFHECAGFSDSAHTRPASPTDRYWLYSCTKPLTVATAMRAMEDGLFALEDPVSKYLPAYKDVYLMKDGERITPKTTMTIRHLMTMTAGLNYNKERESIRCAQQRANGCATTVQIAEALAEDPLDFEPGERFQYSLCHDVLGAVIEQASGQSFRDYMQSVLLRPLDMTDTDFETAGAPKRLAALYAYNTQTDRVSLQSGRNDFVLSPAYYSGGAGVVSTALDYLAFADAMACGGVGRNGQRVLKAESIDLLRTEQISSFMAIQKFSCTCGPDYGYGLGVRTRSHFNEGVRSAVGEFGWDGAAGADLLVDPEHHLSMVYVQHVLGWPAMVGAVHLRIRDILYPLLNLA